MLKREWNALIEGNYEKLYGVDATPDRYASLEVHRPVIEAWLKGEDIELGLKEVPVRWVCFDNERTEFRVTNDYRVAPK